MGLGILDMLNGESGNEREREREGGKRRGEQSRLRREGGRFC